MSIYPMVPGHEIVGRVVSVGGHVKKFKPVAIAGVGCLVDSCAFASIVSKDWSSIVREVLY